jgi:serine/threonine-protein kinase
VTTPGSEPVVLTVPDTARGALAHGWPVPIGDGNTILFRTTYRDSSRLALVDLDGGKPEVLPFDAAKPLGYTKGVLTYLRSDGVVMAVAFDLARRQATGTPVTLLEGISRDRVALGAGGDLLYIADRPIGRLTWADARGKRSYLPFGVGQYVWPRLSPDGTRIAVGGGQGSTWVYDITTGVPRRLAAQGIMPEWTPDGKRVLVASGQGTWSEPADGSGPPELLTKGTYFDRHVSPDGRTLIFIRDNMPASKSNDIWTMSLGPDRQLRPFVESPGRDANPRFSPDGGWVAYRTDESQRGRSEVYIRPFPGPGPATQISLGGGMQPVWGADGRRLYYARGAALYVATLSFGPSPRVIARDSLFDIGPANGLANHAHYDVARDGRILSVRYVDDGQSITVVLNWIDEVRRRLREASQR